MPCIKACIRLIRFIFSSGAGHAEFQRQVVLPNIVKFSQALIEKIGKYENEKLKVCVMSGFCRVLLTFLLPSRGLVFRVPLPAGPTLPLITQTTPCVSFRSRSQAPKWLIACSIPGETCYRCLEIVRCASVHGWESWRFEPMEEICRRDFGIYTKRPLLAQGRLSRYSSLMQTLRYYSHGGDRQPVNPRGPHDLHTLEPRSASRWNYCFMRSLMVRFRTKTFVDHP